MRTTLSINDELLERAREPHPSIMGEAAAFVKTMDATGPWEPVPILLAGCHPNGAIDGALMDMIKVKKPVLFDCRVAALENCFPMIPSGKPHNEMLLGDASTEGAIQAGGAVLV